MEDTLLLMLCNRWACFLASRASDPGKIKLRRHMVGVEGSPLAAFSFDISHTCTGSVTAAPSRTPIPGCIPASPVPPPALGSVPAAPITAPVPGSVGGGDGGGRAPFPASAVLARYRWGTEWDLFLSLAAPDVLVVQHSDANRCHPSWDKQVPSMKPGSSPAHCVIATHDRGSPDSVESKR
jgi:hypothetical protein